jgi:hypothetical protein
MEPLRRQLPFYVIGQRKSENEAHRFPFRALMLIREDWERNMLVAASRARV